MSTDRLAAAAFTFTIIAIALGPRAMLTVVAVYLGAYLLARAAQRIINWGLPPVPDNEPCCACRRLNEHSPICPKVHDGPPSAN